MSGSVYSGTPLVGGKRAGVIALTVDGDAIDVASDFEYDPNVVKRESMVGQSGYQGYSETPKVGSIKFTARDAGNMTVAMWMAKTSSTIIAQLANGKQVSADGIVCIECGGVKTAEGTFELTFEGPSVIEQPL